MLKPVAILISLSAAAPALAQEGARTDFATVKRLVVQAASALSKREPADLALAVAQVNLGDEVAAALKTRPAPGLKVSPR
jgi:hypothetical protein